MPKSNNCPESHHLPTNPIRHNPSGWPHGRVLCSACGNIAIVNRDGGMRAHKPIHIATVNAYTREEFEQLMTDNPDLIVAD